MMNTATMTLAQKLAARQLVLTYLEAVKQQAETELGAEDLDWDAFNRHAQTLADANTELLKARTGLGWVAFYDDARAALEGK